MIFGSCASTNGCPVQVCLGEGCHTCWEANSLNRSIKKWPFSVFRHRVGVVLNYQSVTSWHVVTWLACIASCVCSCICCKSFRVKDVRNNASLLILTPSLVYTLLYTCWFAAGPSSGASMRACCSCIFGTSRFRSKIVIPDSICVCAGLLVCLLTLVDGLWLTHVLNMLQYSYFEVKIVPSGEGCEFVLEMSHSWYPEPATNQFRTTLSVFPSKPAGRPSSTFCQCPWWFAGVPPTECWRGRWLCTCELAQAGEMHTNTSGRLRCTALCTRRTRRGAELLLVSVAGGHFLVQRIDMDGFFWGDAFPIKHI